MSKKDAIVAGGDDGGDSVVVVVVEEDGLGCNVVWMAGSFDNVEDGEVEASSLPSTPLLLFFCSCRSNLPSNRLGR